MLSLLPASCALRLAQVAATRPPAVDDGRVDKRDDDGVYAVGGALDLSLMCAYNPALGFQVAIDGAINLKVEKGPKGELVWPVAVAGVVPASSYFAGDAAGLLAAHTWFVSNISPASTLKCPRWQEGIKHVYGLPFLGHRAALLVQVLGMSRGEVERGTRTVTQVSSGILPDSPPWPIVAGAPLRVLAACSLPQSVPPSPAAACAWLSEASAALGLL